MKKIFLSIIALFTLLLTTNITKAREISEVPHWQKATISVYIPKQDDNNKSGSMKRAFARWQGVSSNRIHFRYVEKGPADIDVIWAENASGSSPISSTSISANGNIITKAEVSIAVKNPNFSKYSNNYVYTVMLHEIGKALGMPVNDRKKSSIMYAPISVQQDIMKIDVMKLYSINGWSYATRNYDYGKATPKEEAQPKPTTKPTTATPKTPQGTQGEKPNLDEITPQNQPEDTQEKNVTE